MENPHTSYKQAWLPTSKEEIKRLGWDHIDVILFSGDAYIDHPSMGCAVIGRVLEAHGYNVAIIPQPNWQDDLRDFRKLGAPRLFFSACRQVQWTQWSTTTLPLDAAGATMPIRQTDDTGQDPTIPPSYTRAF